MTPNYKNSFDIFDTTLTRLFARPTDLFYELGIKLRGKQLISISPEEWMKLRIESEITARKFSSRGEVTLLQIYDYIKESIQWSDNSSESAMKMEIELERQYLKPIPYIQKKVMDLHNSGKPVIYISDTYFSQRDIRSFLNDFNLLHENDSIYLSSEYNCNKENGKLFSICLKKENLLPNQIFHTGDNYKADVKVAAAMGIKSEHFNDCQLDRYEKIIIKNISVPLNVRSKIAGICKYARLKYCESDEQKKTVWDTAVNVSSVVLFGYVYWCILESQKNNIKRLYFIARDGQILSKIGKIICKNWNFDIECKYIYGSRHAWHFPAITKVDENTLNWIFDPTEFLSVKSVFERVNLDPSEFSEFLEKNNFLKLRWDENLTADERASLKEIFKNEDLINCILKKASEYRENTIQYLKQEGIADSIKYALVDIGWRGNLQYSLSNILTAAGIYPNEGLYGFYFGLDSKDKIANLDNLFSYYYHPNPLNNENKCLHKAIIEIFVSATHGGTVGYEKKGASIIPLLRSKNNPIADEWGIELHQQAVLDVTNMLTSYIEKDTSDLSDYLLQINQDILKEFISNPSRNEASVFGKIKISEDQCDNIYYEISPVFKVKDLIPCFKKRKLFHHNVWIQGSKVRSGIFMKKMIEIFEMLVNLKRRLIKGLRLIRCSNLR